MNKKDKPEKKIIRKEKCKLAGVMCHECRHGFALEVE
jgi:hypothetical protein